MAHLFSRISALVTLILLVDISGQVASVKVGPAGGNLPEVASPVAWTSQETAGGNVIFLPLVLRSKRGNAGDLWADVIIGQPDFSQITPNEVVGNKLFNPGGVYVDRSVRPNRIYIDDAGNSRILAFSHLGWAQGGPNAGKPCSSDSDYPGSTCKIDPTLPPNFVLGQPTLISSACNGDSGYQGYPDFPPAGPSTLCGLRQDQVSITEGGSMISMAADSQGNLYIPDFFNNRILRYNNPFLSDTTADYVWGQPDFARIICNQGTGGLQPDNKSLCLAPPPGFGTVKSGVALDPQGNLWVTDTQNNRVLRFPKNSTSGIPDPTADLVLGQPNFNTKTSGDNLSQMSSPSAVRVDTNGVVYIADRTGIPDGLGRVLVFHPPFSNGMAAAQSLTDGMAGPTGLELDTQGGLWVNDCDKGRLLRYVNGNLVQTVVGIPDRVWGGLGIDTDNKIILTGWDPQQVLVYSAPYREWTPFVQADSYGSFNHVGSSSLDGPHGVAATASQLIVSDGSRLLYWNNPAGLKNFQAASGVVGEADFQTKHKWDPIFLRLTPEGESLLWVIKGYSYDAGQSPKILGYPLPLKTGEQPAVTIQSPLPLKGGGNFTWSWSLINGGISYQPGCDCLWASDRDNNRAFRIRNISTSPVVDIVLGQKDIVGTHCNQGRDSDNQYVYPSHPSQDSLCAPGGMGFDRLGNLFLSDDTLEIAGNGRLLEYDAGIIPGNPSSVIYDLPASRSYGRNGSFTEPNCQPGDPMCFPWQPAFNSKNQMIVGFNGYYGSHFPELYSNPLANPFPTAAVKDYYSHAFSAAFDPGDNLYVIDFVRNRVLIYWKPVFP